MQTLHWVAKFKNEPWTLYVESLKETIEWRILQDNIECQALNPKRSEAKPQDWVAN